MKEIRYQGKYITTNEEVIDSHTYERTELIPNVHVLPTRDNKILFMNEFRRHEKGSRWKLVSGWCDKDGVSPVDHAKEELAEEVNMQADHWEELFYANVPNATVNLNTHYFLCTDISDLEINVPNPDIGSEVLEYDWFDYDQIFELLNEQKMWPGASTMIAVWYLYNLQNKKSL